MSVSEAAKTVGVGRPALSNMLNGNAALSPEMAARIARAFGANEQELMDMQAGFDAQVAKQKGVAAEAKSYVPPFLQIKASTIEEWAETIASRSRFAVFLRTLANSTGLQISKIDFPGNDDAERPGWDGYVEAGEGTPWVPVGASGWEFGVNANPKLKAESDYVKRVANLPKEERATTTFVFVTPRRWPDKADWEKDKKARKEWRDVRVYDASDLEQWLEQSIPAQAWLANERNIPSDGVLSLDACWQQWVADCEPAPSPMLFAPSVDAAKLAASNKLAKGPGETLVVSADSIVEALGFVSCLFDAEELAAYREQVVVFTKAGVLGRLASKSSRFIAICTNREVEKELAPHRKNLRSIVIYPRNATTADPDIILEPLNYEPFEKALLAMGCNRDDVNRYSHESGRSLTVLRRRLSKLDAIRVPAWAADNKTARSLIPFLYAGSWNSRAEPDKVILGLLAEDADYAELEQEIARLLPIDDTPVWSAGSYRGLVSKIDVLYAISSVLTKEDIDRLIGIAEIVLSEDDPSLQLPEEERWAAGVHGKTREISAALRDGICETLVLLAVHGDNLLRGRLGIDCEAKVASLVRKLLTPLTTHVLEAHSGDFPMYAEAAPREILNLLEADIASENSQSIGLMRPASSGIFGRCPRTGLLWALENLAWSPEFLPRAVLVLGKLSEVAIEDNWGNKPRESLASIFRCWMPQTAASLEQRSAAIDLLAAKHPKVAWDICVHQFNGESRVGNYSHKPRWRTDGHGFGEPLKGERTKEFRAFMHHCFSMALDWKQHDRDTVGDLVGCIGNVDEEAQAKIWAVVETWSKTASEDDRAWMREKIRTSALTRRAIKRQGNERRAEKLTERARAAYAALLPKDVVLKNEWLFRKHWVDESADELEVEEIDFRARDQRIERMRVIALKEVYATKGVEGILALAERGEAGGVIGSLFAKSFASQQVLDGLKFVLAQGKLGDSPPRRMVVIGAMGTLSEPDAQKAMAELTQGLDHEEAVAFLVLCPFAQATWDFAKSLGTTIGDSYWKAVNPGWSRNTPEELQLAVDALLAVKRPRAAFAVIHFEMDEIPPKQMFRLLRSMAGTEEANGAYQLERHDMRKAFELLNKSGEIASAELAGLEFQYIDIFDDENGGLPNLEKQIESNPELYVQAVAFAYKRDDGGEDPAHLRVDDQEARSNRALGAYKLLENLSRIPGRDQDGNLVAEAIVKWVTTVRAGCKELARGDVCDLALGKLFSAAPIGEDGIWPCRPVREALERVATEHMERGITTGLYNARGVHWRGEGGGQERELADKYRKWAQALDYTHPRVAKILNHMAETYEQEAKWHDTDAAVRKRLRY